MQIDTKQAAQAGLIRTACSNLCGGMPFMSVQLAYKLLKKSHEVAILRIDGTEALKRRKK